jgi:drug/metabolite transporter (DMT)-like permease
MKTEMFILIAILGWGVGSFFSKLSNTAMHPLMVASVSLLTYMVVLPLALIFSKFDHSVSVQGIVVTVVGSLCMCAGTLGFAFALRNGAPVGQATILAALNPMITLALSMIFLHEGMTVRKGIGIIFALVSFFFLSLK